jgi:hypothetical protein
MVVDTRLIFWGFILAGGVLGVFSSMNNGDAMLAVIFWIISLVAVIGLSLRNEAHFSGDLRVRHR